MTRFKQGWFTRLCRKLLEAEWATQEMKLGPVMRHRAKRNVWRLLMGGQYFGLQSMQRLFWERFNIAEQRVLKGNQDKFRKAINQFREDPDVNQPQLPGITTMEDKFRYYFKPIKDVWLKDPGADGDFRELCRCGEVDFEIIYNMAVVRDEKTRELLISKADYDFMDRARRHMKDAKTTTIGQILVRHTPPAA